MTQNWSDVNTVRKTFVDFFVEKCGHNHIVSSPVVPHDDPTLLFINAGMNQFKSIFVGTVDPNSEFGKLKRAANSQKCIRAGGKHNDLEDVGKDSYHHTFFEMLGNWSFGDYFKIEAIDWAWELLTKVYGLNPDRLYVTYFGGDERIPTCKPDLEARDLWLRYLPADRVLPYGAKENFWEMAETGPCGPCSEIHYDRIGGRQVANLVNADDPTVVEIWNLVFMQYNREIDRSLTPLPFGSVDTGMGMERLASILIDRPSNYDISGFQHIFKTIQKTIPSLAEQPYTGREGANDADGKDMAYRVVADHIRTLSIAIADGAMPSNDGRGYVLRRILRRAVRYGKQKLDAPSKPWFCKLVQSVVDTLGQTFPSLVEKQAHIEQVIEAEERQFTSTLERGLREFDRVLKDTQSKGLKKFPGGEPGAFTLFTTFGFPLDLTKLMVEEHGLDLDMDEYDRFFEEHRRKAREGGKKVNNFEFKLQQEQLHILANEYNATRADESNIYNWSPSKSTGCSVDAKVIAILTEKNGFQKSVTAEDQLVGVVVDATNFYPEAGGQVADIGVISGTAQDDDFSGSVEDVQRFGTFICHTVKLNNGAIFEGQTVTLTPDYERRAATGKNHTATHILNFALREVLGNEVAQKGSLVDNTKTRFDFSYNSVVSTEDLKKIQDIVNKEIASKRNVDARAVALEDARKIPGLRFLDGEQYPNPVRVLSLSDDVLAMTNSNYAGQGGFIASVEFCGGTHMSNSADIEDFVLMTEEGVAKGIRRVVGVTGEIARVARRAAAELAKSVAELKTFSGDQLDSKLSALRGALEACNNIPLVNKRELLADVDALKAAQLEIAKANLKAIVELAKTKGAELAATLQTSEPSVFVVDELEGDSKAVDQCSKTIESAAKNKAFVLISGKVNSSCSIVVVGGGHKNLDAKAALDAINAVSGTRGNGKPTRALASAKTITAEQYAAAVEAANKFVNAL